MARIVFQGYGMNFGLGDALVDLKVLYAIKQLYPNDELVYYYPQTALPLFSKIAFIDTIIDSRTTSLDEIRAMNPDIFITIRRKGSFFRYLKTLRFKKAIVLPHFESFFSRTLTTPFPFFRRKMHWSDIALTLVRTINPKHYDANINKINFNKVKDFLPKNTALSDEFLQSVKFPYKKIIGINPFAQWSEQGTAMNFFTSSWLNLSFELAQLYPEFLFILMNFEKNRIQFHIQESQNLRVFVNNDDLVSLVDISSKLDLLMTPVTGNMHLCDVLQKPILALIIEKDTYRALGGGGSYKREQPNEIISVKAGWQKEYQKVLHDFTQKAKLKCDMLTKMD